MTVKEQMEETNAYEFVTENLHRMKELCDKIEYSKDRLRNYASIKTLMLLLGDTKKQFDNEMRDVEFVASFSDDLLKKLYEVHRDMTKRYLDTLIFLVDDKKDEFKKAKILKVKQTLEGDSNKGRPTYS